MKKMSKFVVTAAVFLLVAGTAYLISRRDTGINEEPRAEAEEENRMETCESTEDVVEEEPASLEEPETVSAQSGEETWETSESVSEAETQWRVYDTLSEIGKAWGLPYVDEATFAWIQAAYEEVDFSGEFEKGNPDTYEEYQEIFRKLIRNEVPYVDPETGEKFYIKDGMLNWNEEKELEEYEYRFFDIDGDGMQELYLYYWFGGYDHFLNMTRRKRKSFYGLRVPMGGGRIVN